MAVSLRKQAQAIEDSKEAGSRSAVLEKTAGGRKKALRGAEKPKKDIRALKRTIKAATARKAGAEKRRSGSSEQGEVSTVSRKAVSQAAPLRRKRVAAAARKEQPRGAGRPKKGMRAVNRAARLAAEAAAEESEAGSNSQQAP